MCPWLATMLRIWLLAVLAFVATPVEAAGVLEPEVLDEIAPSPSPEAESYPAMTLEDKQVAEADSAAADKRVTVLEKERDEAWHASRGDLALASSPPIRSSAVFGARANYSFPVSQQQSPLPRTVRSSSPDVCVSVSPGHHSSLVP